MIYYSHGDKGGVGKSMTSAVLLDYLLSKAEKPMLIEGDEGQPDIALRYADYVPVQCVNLNRAGDAEAAIMAFTDALEALGDGDIVVNLPAAAGDTLEQLAEVLVGAAEELGHESRVFYTMGHTPTASKNALKSFETGLIHGVGLDNACIVYPTFLGKTENFDWVKSGLRDRFNVREIVMPAISPEELAQVVLSAPGTFAELADKSISPLKMSERLIFQSRFYRPAMEAIAAFDKE
ncbi:hypothetical protein HF289_08700 [Acidithiobacillus ferrooxidans]|uniref:hypothetical protein n=1 Tax=Acidithiobacillus ferrooxidans TaxID=920 RepID=UPI001C074786|nr:hypothetical protein [Acidithiobacillus ferrooxidans]MBU2856949.1 hypothetical protein [Acidithiobacillus ferrooxidans]